MGVTRATKLRQRVIGIVIIIALAVIFLPNVWQKSNFLKLKVRQIPTPPQPTNAQTMQAIPQVKSQAATPLKEVAWTLHLGSFANKQNAQRLLKQLRANHYPAYSQRIDNAQGSLTKVYVGPETKQVMLQNAATKIAKTLHLKGKIVPFAAITENLNNDEG